jgi:uncharacterized protein (TIGR03086 family)
MIDLAPATRGLTDLVRAVRPEQLPAPTPCKQLTVGDLVDHVDGLSLAFAAAARKTVLPDGSGQSMNASRLGDDWRERIPGRLAELAEAWRDDSAWQGMTKVGGLDLPGEIAGVIALNEVVLHSWDLAVATGQPYSCPDALIETARGFVASAVAENPNGTPGLFGPPVAVPADAPLLDRLVGLAGRAPVWRPTSPTRAGVAGGSAGGS